MKRFLLTGATGYLGSHLAKAMLAAGYELIALKRNTSSVHRIGSDATRIKLFDIEHIDLDALFRETGPVDAIIHTATCYGRNNESVNEIFTSNTEFPLHLLDAGSRAGVKVFFNTDTILDKYLNPYALSKNQLLQWGKFFSKNGKIRFVNIRLEHFYGAGDDPTKFTTFLIRRCIENEPELRLTEGRQKRDFIHIDDVIAAYMTLLSNATRLSGAFVELDVGSGQAVPIREFVEVIHRLTGSKTRLNFGALPYRDEEVMHSEANISKLKALGWRCRHDLESGLSQVLRQEREIRK